MAKTQTRPWDATDYLETEEDIVAYLKRRSTTAIRGL